MTLRLLTRYVCNRYKIWHGKALCLASPTAPDILLQIAAEFAAQHNFDRTYAGIQRKLGVSWAVVSEYDTAMIYWQRSLRLFKELGDRKGAGQVLGNMAIVYHRQGDYVRSIEYHTESLQIAEELNDSTRAAQTRTNIGILLYAQGKYQESTGHLVKRGRCFSATQQS